MCFKNLQPRLCFKSRYNEDAMRKFKLYALMITTALLALAAVVGSALASLMMFVGVCGVAVFSSPSWPLQLFIVLAVPAAFVFVAVKVWRYCLRQLPFASLR